jgi:hypothetical protein
MMIVAYLSHEQCCAIGRVVDHPEDIKIYDSDDESDESEDVIDC